MEKNQVDILQQLKHMKKQGILSEEEFQHQKNVVLGGDIAAITDTSPKSMWQYYLDAFRKYFQFSGRASRREWCSFVLINTVVSGIFSLTPLSPLYSLFVTIPTWTVAVRRIHDSNMSGWKMLNLFGFLFLTLFVIIFSLGIGKAFAQNSVVPQWVTFIDGNKNIICLIGSILVLYWFLKFFYWMLKKGDDVDNQYGPALPLSENKYSPLVAVIGVFTIIVPLCVVFAGVFSGYNKTMTKYSNDKAIAQILLFVQKVEDEYTRQGNYNGQWFFDMPRFGDTLDMAARRGGYNQNIYGGKIMFTGAGSSYVINYTNVPKKDCSSLASNSSVTEILNAACFCRQDTCLLRLKKNNQPLKTDKQR